MSVIATDERRAATKGVAAVVRRPRLRRRAAKLSLPAGGLALRASRPLLRRQARKRVHRLRGAARTIARVVTEYGPDAAYGLGLAQPPRQRATAPRVAAGVVIGAGAMYLLEPEKGRERQRKVLSIVT